MRRVLAGIFAGGLGAAFFAWRPTDRFSHVIAVGIAIGVYGAIDRLGLLPAPFKRPTDLFGRNSDKT